MLRAALFVFASISLASIGVAGTPPDHDPSWCHTGEVTEICECHQGAAENHQRCVEGQYCDGSDGTCGQR